MVFPEYVAFTLDRLEENGYTAYLVGGCVRDSIMGIEPYDFDVTTNATPEQIEKCFFDVKTLDIGKKHGTISIVFDKEIVEVTTYRIDGEYKDSRHPESVTFTDKIEDDLSRRDFTINAIAYSPKRGFVDPFCGRQDIEKKIIRCVGNPRVRFEEDALRIMRGLRFASRLGFEIEKDTSDAIFEKKHLLLNVALERINSELAGILCGSYAASVLRNNFEVLKTIIPKLSEICFDALLRSADFSLTVKLCLLFYKYSDRDNLSNELKRLKFDGNTVKTVTALLEFSDGYAEKWNDKDVKRAVSKIGEQYTNQLYPLLYCIHGDNRYMDAHRKFRIFEEQRECMTLSALDVKGNEIIDLLNINPSKTGHILSLLLDDVIEEIIPNQKSALLERAKHYTGID